jgi:hypothetical protein
VVQSEDKPPGGQLEQLEQESQVVQSEDNPPGGQLEQLEQLEQEDNPPGGQLEQLEQEGNPPGGQLEQLEQLKQDDNPPGGQLGQLEQEDNPPGGQSSSRWCNPKTTSAPMTAVSAPPVLFRVGQDRIYTSYTTVRLVISLPNNPRYTPYIYGSGQPQ